MAAVVNRRIALVAMTLVLLLPTRAWAHAHLKRSDPAAGSRLSDPPRLIHLWFTERPELAVTFAALTDSSGKVYPLGPAARDTSAQMGVVFEVSDVLPPGRYTVSWRTAAADGHPSNGKFSFAVLERTNGGSGNNTSLSNRADSGKSVLKTGAPQATRTTIDANDADHASSLDNSLARALLFAALLALIGTLSFRFLVLPQAREVPADLRNRMGDRAAKLGMAAAAIVILVALVRVYLESQMMSAMPDMPGMQGMDIRDMLMQTEWGIAVDIQLTAAVAALIGFALSLRRIRAGWFIAVAAAVVIAITPAIAGHAAATPRLTSFMIAADFLHVLGAASWLGSLLCLMVIGIPVVLVLDAPHRWASMASLVNSFSRLAQVSVLVLLASGVFASWVHLEHLSALWHTRYGNILLVKLALVAITVALGAYNFKRVQPNLSNQLGVERLRRSASTELATAILVLLVTGLLTGVSP